ncbi:hypothetical protein J3459_016002 [Metarhizium acridum]|nr:hypothetical protein J3459_016002 [Metarhizium acridum]
MRHFALHLCGRGPPTDGEFRDAKCGHVETRGDDPADILGGSELLKQSQDGRSCFYMCRWLGVLEFSSRQQFESPGRNNASAGNLASSSKDGFPSVEYYKSLDDAQTDADKLPVEEARLTTAPNVPPAITRKHAVLLRVPLQTITSLSQVTNQYKYEAWTFNGNHAGPLYLRTSRRRGRAVPDEPRRDGESAQHRQPCVRRPGGGSALTTAEENETKTGRFKLLCPGAPEEQDLPPVDREYYVMQSEIYHEPPGLDDDGRPLNVVEFSYPRGLREEPNAVVFNGREVCPHERRAAQWPGSGRRCASSLATRDQSHQAPSTSSAATSSTATATAMW